MIVTRQLILNNSTPIKLSKHSLLNNPEEESASDEIYVRAMEILKKIKVAQNDTEANLLIYNSLSEALLTGIGVAFDDKLTDEEFEKALELGKTLRVEKTDGELDVWFDNEIAKRGVEAHRAMEKRLREKGNPK